MRDGARSGDVTGLSSIFRYIIGLIELWMIAMVLILTMTFFLGLLGANPDTSFAAWIHHRSDEIMTPFDNILDPIELTGHTIIQTSVLFAMAVYGALAAVLDGIGRRIGS